MRFQFKVFDKTTKQLFSYEDIKTKTLTEIFDDPNHLILPYLGFMDANKQDIYAGDILHMKITEDLMQTSFANSNLGIHCKSKNIKQVFLLLQPNRVHFNTPHALYRKAENVTDYPKTNGWFTYNDKNHTIAASFGTDLEFPIYLCMKGAVIIGNILENPDLLPEKASEDIYETSKGEYE